jgi:hypothetical protein
VTVAAHYAPGAAGQRLGDRPAAAADQAAVVQALVGDGRVVCSGPRVYRGQPWATFKLLFNAILGSVQRR